MRTRANIYDKRESANAGELIYSWNNIIVSLPSPILEASVINIHHALTDNELNTNALSEPNNMHYVFFILKL